MRAAGGWRAPDENLAEVSPELCYSAVWPEPRVPVNGRRCGVIVRSNGHRVRAGLVNLFAEEMFESQRRVGLVQDSRADVIRTANEVLPSAIARVRVLRREEVA